MNKIQEFTEKLKNKPFIQSIINDLNGDVLAVGGIIRDLILNKPNKDIDLVVKNRSEERRVGKECVSLCRSRWSPYH